MSVSSQLPPLYATDIKWGNATNGTTISLVASGSGTNPIPFTGNPIDLNIFAVCAPGQFVNLGSLNMSSDASLLFEYLSSTNAASLCVDCANGTIAVQESTQCSNCPSGTYATANRTQCLGCAGNSWAFPRTHGACIPCAPGYVAANARDKCITLKFSIPPPSVLTSLFQLPSIVAVDNFNFTHSFNGSVDVSLSCSSENCSAIQKGDTAFAKMAFMNAVASFLPQTFPYIIDDYDSVIGRGYSWVISSSNINTMLVTNVIPLGIRVVYPEAVSVLGPLPSIVSINPLVVPFTGNTVVSITSRVWTVEKGMRLRTATCRLSLMDSVQTVFSAATTLSVEALPLLGSDGSTRTCNLTLPQTSPFRFWNVSIVLEDGRSSDTMINLTTVCPNNYFIQNNSCIRCPSSSFNSLINAASIESCLCSPGSYGNFGYGCKQCPKLPGFNCSLPNQALPIIRPGYYGDYSLLHSCDATAEACAALMTCPFGERACPGGGDKLCTRKETECYDGRACSQCCPLFYLENGQCNACPDPSTSAAFLAVMMVIVIVFAVLLSTSQSPSLSQSLKYFVMTMNFYQNIQSVKLINIDWPPELQQLFNALAYFSFSISSVRPECSFSWSFETRIVVTLLLPVALSLFVLSIGLVFGTVSCRRFLNRMHQLRSDGAKLPLLRLSSIFNCWLHSVCFLPVEWNPQMFIWYALSPELEARGLGRGLRTSEQNWAVFKTNLKSKILSNRVFGVARRSNRVHAAPHAEFLLKDLQKVMFDSGLDCAFAAAVDKGRKFFSGVFSILVLSFVGTLTSALSSFSCEERDRTWFLVQEPTIECSISSPQYMKLSAISITAIFLYAVVVPLFVLFSLWSRWSCNMRSNDRNAFDALFGFLTSRYSSGFFMWELVTFFYKAVSVSVPVFYSSSPIKQSVVMSGISIVYITLLFSYSPFANTLMNFVEKSCHVSVFIMYFSAFIFTCDVAGSPILDNAQKSAVAILLCIICIISSVLCVVSSVYEYFFSLLFHRDLLISKWTRALRLAIGDSLQPFSNLFLFFYVFYNHRTRNNIVQKKRKLNEQMAQLLLLEGTEAYEQAPWWKRLAMRVNRGFELIRFGVKNRNILDCEPAVLKEALLSPEAKLMRCFSKIEDSMSRGLFRTRNNAVADSGQQSGGQSSIMRLLRKLAFWKTDSGLRPAALASRVLPSSEFEPPVDFIRNFADKHLFIIRSFSPASISIWLTILLFNEKCDMGDSQEATFYLSRMVEQLGSMQQAMRSTFTVVQDILRKDNADTESTHTAASESTVVRFIKSVYLGSEGICLVRFAKMPYLELADVMEHKGLQAFSRHENYVFPISQLIEAQSQTNFRSIARKVLRIRNMTINDHPNLLDHTPGVGSDVNDGDTANVQSSLIRSRPKMYSSTTTLTTIDVTSSESVDNSSPSKTWEDPCLLQSNTPRQLGVNASDGDAVYESDLSTLERDDLEQVESFSQLGVSASDGDAVHESDLSTLVRDDLEQAESSNQTAAADLADGNQVVVVADAASTETSSGSVPEVSQHQNSPNSTLASGLAPAGGGHAKASVKGKFKAAAAKVGSGFVPRVASLIKPPPTLKHETSKEDNPAAKPKQDDAAAKPKQDDAAAKPKQDDAVAKPKQDDAAAVASAIRRAEAAESALALQKQRVVMLEGELAALAAQVKELHVALGAGSGLNEA